MPVKILDANTIVKLVNFHIFGLDDSKLSKYNFVNAKCSVESRSKVNEIETYSIVCEFTSPLKKKIKTQKIEIERPYIERVFRESPVNYFLIFNSEYGEGFEILKLDIESINNFYSILSELYNIVSSGNVTRSTNEYRISKDFFNQLKKLMEYARDSYITPEVPITLNNGKFKSIQSVALFFQQVNFQYSRSIVSEFFTGEKQNFEPRIVPVPIKYGYNKYLSDFMAKNNIKVIIDPLQILLSNSIDPKLQSMMLSQSNNINMFMISIIYLYNRILNDMKITDIIPMEVKLPDAKIVGNIEINNIINTRNGTLENYIIANVEIDRINGELEIKVNGIPIYEIGKQMYSLFSTEVISSEDEIVKNIMSNIINKQYKGSLSRIVMEGGSDEYMKMLIYGNNIVITQDKYLLDKIFAKIV